MGTVAERTGPAGAGVSYAMVLQQVRAAPPGKVFLFHGTPGVFRLSLSAAAHVLVSGVPITLVDGTNRFDLYYIARYARRFSHSPRGAHGGVTPEKVLDNIFISRAFTCYQMEALVTDRLPAFARKVRSPLVIIFGLLDTFYDEQAPMFEVRRSLARIIGTLHRLKQQGFSVLLASVDVRSASAERRSLFPSLASAMDRVYAVTEGEAGLNIRLETPPGRRISAGGTERS